MFYNFVLLVALGFSVPSAVAAELVRLLDDAITIELPEGYSALREEEMRIRSARTGRPPLPAFADGNHDATIEISLARQSGPLAPTELPEFMSAIEHRLPRVMAGLLRHEREIIAAGKHDLAGLDLSLPALDGNVTHDMYFTAFGGGVLGLNVAPAAAIGSRRAAPALSLAVRRMRLEERTR